MKRVSQVKICHDSRGNTLNVWCDDPKKEHVCEEAGDEVVLIKDRRGKVIGFEKLNFLPGNRRHRTLKTLPIEVLVSWKNGDDKVVDAEFKVEDEKK